MLTWTAVALLAIGVYGQRFIGATAIDTARLDQRWQRVLTALPLAIISAVIALQSVTSSRTLTLDARLAGLAIAAICAWRRFDLKPVAPPLIEFTLGGNVDLRLIWLHRNRLDGVTKPWQERDGRKNHAGKSAQPTLASLPWNSCFTPYLGVRFRHSSS